MTQDEWGELQKLWAQLQDNWLEPFEPDFSSNLRSAVRFAGNDIKASIEETGLFGVKKTSEVELLDISSKGVLIATDKKLSVKQKTTVTLEFKTGKSFKIHGVVARFSPSNPNQYAIKFAKYQNDLGDYLVESQEILSFK